jgi:hypothetical protein
MHFTLLCHDRFFEGFQYLQTSKTTAASDNEKANFEIIILKHCFHYFCQNISKLR